jgi:hypothetical protein
MASDDVWVEDAEAAGWESGPEGPAGSEGPAGDDPGELLHARAAEMTAKMAIPAMILFNEAPLERGLRSLLSGIRAGAIGRI